MVGAGFSGPILAAKIAERGVNPKTGDRLRIALVDAGPYFKGAPRPGYGSPLRRKMFTNLEDGYGAATYLWNEGYEAKIVGGSSLHWGTEAIPPAPVDYLHWQKETGVDWTEENLRPAVAEIRREFNIHPFPDQMNTRGNKLFYDTAKKMGYDPTRSEVARRNCIYCGFCSLRTMMCKYDSKSGTLMSYIPVAEKHGVEIIPDTFVEKIFIDVKGGRGVARGLACQTGGSKYEIQADKIIVSCGFINTPLLLTRSGYGPKDWKGNPIRVENANIGKNIDGHPFGRPTNLEVRALFDELVQDGDLGNIGGYTMIQDSRSDAEGRLRFGTNFGNSTLPSQAALHPLAPLYGREHKQFMKEEGILRTGSIGITVVKASGRWQIISPDGKLLYGGDHRLTIQRAKEGMEIARGILEKMGARHITPTNIPVNITPQTRGPHRVGSCRAGVDPKTSVVNPYFESHEVENLLIGDGSAIPRVTSGNTGIPTASLAVFAAGRIIERHFQR